MEKFYIVEKDSILAKDYLEYLAFAEKFTDLFEKFAKENNIEASEYYLSTKRLWINPKGQDYKNFGNSFLKSELGKFKINSPLNRKWVELCKENNLSKVIHKPYLPLYFYTFEGKCSSRLFKIKDTIYCSFSMDKYFKAPSGLKEIKGSEFYKAIEDGE
ncbi:MAG TPA: hypothetical protein OIL97_04095 [Oscillospiraceae bacterium]|nr:hypothetical protein [Oscillospiraceae bacterium]